MTLALRSGAAAALRREPRPARRRSTSSARRRASPALVQRGGKELSFNNLLDLEGALLAAEPFARASRAARSSSTRRRAASPSARRALDAYRKALACDPVSAFGSVIAFTVPVDDAAAEAVSQLFVECIVAPSFSEGAVEILGRKKNLRVLEGERALARAARSTSSACAAACSCRSARRRRSATTAGRSSPSARRPTRSARPAVRLAGGGEREVERDRARPRRRDDRHRRRARCRASTRRSSPCTRRSRPGTTRTAPSLGSDAFFPFRDGVDQAAEAGVTAIVQPGGSVRDAEVIAAANEHGIAMVFTGQRLFRH